MSKYPCIDGHNQFKQGTPKKDCVACDKPATHNLCIEWSYMNGEDEYYPVCQRHLQIAQKNLNQFFAHQSTKDNFLKNKGAV